MNNFNVQRELAEQDGSEWKFGALSQPGIVSIPLAERELYLPIGETQFDAFADFTDCASRSPVNHLEALFTYHYRHSMKEENKLWMETKGYVHNNRITFSDRYIAVLSGTTHEGNSLKSPLEAIRKQGLIPKALLPKTDDLNWNDYYAPIPQPLKELGQEFLTRFTINYEQVALTHFADVLKDDCIGVAAFAWPLPINGVYPKTTGNFNHAFLLYNLPQWQIFDNYLEKPEDFTKTLAPNYAFFDYGYRVYVSNETVTQKKSYLFLRNLTYGRKDPDVVHLQTVLRNLGYAIPNGPTDYFGMETKMALWQFQRAHHIDDFGTHCGPQTRMALNLAQQFSFGSLFIIIRTYLGI